MFIRMGVNSDCLIKYDIWKMMEQLSDYDRINMKQVKKFNYIL